MKKLVTAFLVCAAFSAPAFADTPATREMNSFDSLMKLSNPQEETPAAWHQEGNGEMEHAHHRHGHHGHHAHHGEHHHGHHHHKDHPKDAPKQ